MKTNKALLAVLFLLLALLLGLGGLFIWLTGGIDEPSDEANRPRVTGLVHVRSIYTADGENLAKPVGIGSDDQGRFFVTLRDAGRVVEFDRGGDTVRVFGERGLEQGRLMVPTGVAVDRLAQHVYVTDRSRLRLVCYDLAGEFQWEVPLLNPVAPAVNADGVVVTTFGPLVQLTAQGEPQREIGSRGPDPGQFDYARAATVLPGGDVVVADSNNNRVQRVKLSGDATATTVWVDGEPPRFQDDPQVSYGLPSGVASDGRGRLFVVDGFRTQIVVLDEETGERIHTFDDMQGRADGRFNLPTGIAHLGGDRFAITDTYNDRVQIVRLLLPGEDSPVARYPWLWLLLPAALIALLAALLGKKRYYATEGALQTAQATSRLRLVAAVARRLHVLPEVKERFDGAEEAGVVMAEYLVAAEGGGDGDTVERLVRAATPAGVKRWAFPRVRLIVASEDERALFASAPGKVITVDELSREFVIDGEQPDSGESGSGTG